MAEQGTEEWLLERCGKVTASRIADLMSRRKDGKPGAERMNYRAELLIERVTGRPYPRTFTSTAMVHGTETEPEARRAYEFFVDRDVIQVGFTPHPSIEMSGASPDGLVGDDGLLEIKCPQSATHLETLLNECVPEKYRKQMLFQMACTGRQWCDFASYDPRMPEHLRLWVSRVHRDDEAIASIELEVRLFLKDLEETVERLRKTRLMAEAA